MTKELNISDVQEPIATAPPEVRRIIERVLKAERDKLYMKNPRHINDDILTIIKEEVP
jgi:regulator of protease activity HflC (stomatin/prohibitin superfamily)